MRCSFLPTQVVALLPAATALAFIISLGAVGFAQEAAAPERSEPSADEYLAQGVEAYGAAEYERALQLYEQAYALEPKPQLLYAMAQTQRALGDCQAAIELYDRFLESEPSEVAANAARTNRQRCAPSAAPSGSAQPEPHSEPHSDGVSTGTQQVADKPMAQAHTQGTSKPRPQGDASVEQPTSSVWYKDGWGAAFCISGVLVASVGEGFLLAASVNEDDVRTRAADPADGDTAQDHRDALERAKNLKGVGGVGVLLGGALLATGIVRYIAVASREDQSGVQLDVTQSYAGASYTGAFW